MDKGIFDDLKGGEGLFDYVKTGLSVIAVALFEGFMDHPIGTVSSLIGLLYTWEMYMSARRKRKGK